MDCFGTYFTHVQTCDDVRVQSTTEWTASVHTLHMSKPVMTFVFKVLRDGLLRYILYTFPKPVMTFVFKVQYYSVLQSATPLLLCTTKYYSSTTPVLLRTTQYYSSTTPYQKVLLQTLYYFIATPVLPCTTKYYSCYALQVFLLTLRTKTVNQPASLAGRPANTVRPAGPHGSGRPAGWQDGNKIPNKSTVLSKNYCLKLILYIIYK